LGNGDWGAYGNRLDGGGKVRKESTKHGGEGLEDIERDKRRKQKKGERRK